MSALPPEMRSIMTKPLYVPPGFENYFLNGKEPLNVIRSVDLLPEINKIVLGRFVRRLDLHELEPTDNASSHLVFMEDFHGCKALLVIIQNNNGGDVIGGTGVYPTPDGESPVKYALAHTASLKSAMDYKTAMAGLTEHFGLSGMKATVAMEPGQKGLSDWEQSGFLQTATGWLFSQEIFSHAITGTDARQTDNTIGDMAIGSALANPDRDTDRICGTRRTFDTPGACRYSLEATLDILSDKLSVVPSFKGSTVSIQGFGRIGHAAVQLALDRIAKQINLSDVKLPDDKTLYADFLKLQKTYPGRITLVTGNIYEQQADIFIPCSSQEGQLNEKTINELYQAGTTIILAGANNILEEENKWKLARLTDSLGIIMPPEVLSNCGSVTMAGMERVYHSLRKNDPNYTKLPEEEAEIKFRDKIVVPFIRKNAENRIRGLLEIANEMGADIYTAGEIWYLRQQGKEAKFDQNGILISST